MTHGQAMRLYASGLAICAACAFLVLTQIENPFFNLHKPPASGHSSPTGTNPQVTGTLAPRSSLPADLLGGAVTPTPTEIGPPAPSQSPLSSSLSPTTPRRVPVPTPTTRRPPQTTTAPRPPSPPTTKPKPPVLPPLTPLCNGLDVLPQVSRGCNDILGNVVGALTGVTAVGGRGARPDNPTSCHPKGLALDLMVRSRLTGDLIVTYVRLNKTRLGITTILWQVPDHYDHVHLSFSPCTK